MAAAATADELREQGNDAFRTGDFQRANDLYTRSTELDPSSAKAFCNLSAVQSKLGKYDDAAESARAATELDQGWAKAWWRRGITENLRQKDALGLMHLKKALELEPGNKAFKDSFQQALSKAEARVDADGNVVLSAKGRQGSQVTEEGGKNLGTGLTALFKQAAASGGPGGLDHSTSSIVSDPYSARAHLVRTLGCWSDALAECRMNVLFSSSPSPVVEQLRNKYLALATDPRAAGSLELKQAQMMVGKILGARSPFEGPMSALDLCMHSLGASQTACCLGPDLLPPLTSQGLSAPGPEDNPTTLMNYVCQNLAIARANAFQGQYGKGVDVQLPDPLAQQLEHRLPQHLKPPASRWSPGSGRAALTPSAAVAYYKAKQKGGLGWGQGLRALVSLSFKGSLVYAHIVRMAGLGGEAYAIIQWAVEFIARADEELLEGEDESDKGRGSSFLPTMRRAALLMLIASAGALRGASGDARTFNPITEVKAALSVVRLLRENPVEGREDIGNVHAQVAYGRMHFKLAYSSLASNVSTYLQNDREILEEEGLLEEGSNKNVWAVVTQLYMKAAENELRGGQEKAILCWGVAANMCRVGPHRDDHGGASYSVGDLRAAIARAREAARERDTELFGEDPDANGTYVTQAEQMEEWFRDAPDDMDLPEMLIDFGPAPVGSEYFNIFVKGADGRVTHSVDQSKVKAQEDAKRAEKLGPGKEAQAEQVREHGMPQGADSVKGPPSLATIALRQLHEDRNELAVGQGDPAVVAAAAAAAPDAPQSE